MKKILLFGAIALSTLTFGQYPSWFPSEFRNKVFCGEIEVSGKMPYTNTVAFTKVPYKLYIQEDGIKLEINPGEKFGRNEWGETIKVGFKTLKIEKTSMAKHYEIDLSFNNESSDSPTYPKYNLNKLVVGTFNYDGHKLTKIEERNLFQFRKEKSIESIKNHNTYIRFGVNVPYYPTTLSGNNINLLDTPCKTIKTKVELEKEKAEIERLNTNVKQILNQIEPKITSSIIDASELYKENKELLRNSDKLSNEVYNYSNEIYSSIQDNLIKYYKDNPINIQNFITPENIEMNKSILKNMSSGEYKIMINKNNKLNTSEPSTFNNYEIDLFNRYHKDYNLIYDESFDIFKCISFNVKIEIKDPVLIKTEYLSSSSKPIYSKNETSYYFKTKNNLDKLNYTYYPIVPKGKVRVVKTYKKETFANGILINSVEYKEGINYDILKKDK